MFIKELPEKEYKDYVFIVEYKTSKFYDVEKLKHGFRLKLRELEKGIVKGFKGHLFSEDLEEPIAFGVFENNELMGFVEGSKEKWHKLFRINNIFVFEKYRRRGFGKYLLQYIIDYAVSLDKYRGIILETESCNYWAIELYRKFGFKLCRIDTHEYSNNDILNKEIRIDLILEL